MEISCVIVDDEPLARKVLKSYIDDIPELRLAAQLKSALELRDFLMHEHTDIIFLDINMPKISGMEFIKSSKPDSHVVFTTAYPEYAVDAFELQASDYLVKPISFERFLKCIERIKDIEFSADQSGKEWLVVKQDRRLYKVHHTEILFIQAYGDYVKIITPPKTYVTKEKLNVFEDLLSPEFRKCHRSYIVNLSKIDYLEGNFLKIDQHQIPISSGLKSEFLKYFK